jgi:hypothetical protein
MLHFAADCSEFLERQASSSSSVHAREKKRVIDTKGIEQSETSLRRNARERKPKQLEDVRFSLEKLGFEFK